MQTHLQNFDNSNNLFKEKKCIFKLGEIWGQINEVVHGGPNRFDLPHISEIRPGPMPSHIRAFRAWLQEVIEQYYGEEIELASEDTQIGSPETQSLNTQPRTAEKTGKPMPTDTSTQSQTEAIPEAKSVTLEPAARVNPNAGPLTVNPPPPIQGPPIPTHPSPPKDE
jgi:hypothetical protein